MRCKHLELQGYKSFADKAEFLFPTGITAIVGPNGSGKSNIADAIRWVMGEQSMRSLRGKSTADMIYAGGRRRARAGVAEVSLTFDNTDGWLPVEFSEVTIGRRAYRSGQNDYLLNGSKVRLRDIDDMLAESGLSQRAYTVIGQGMVDAALALRAHERRALFEEAAGITLHRSRREDALDRLEETQHNLERVYDIVAEVEPRLRRLEREVERVEEHRRVSEHLERLQRTWYGFHWGRQQADLRHALRKAQALESKLTSCREEAVALEGRLEDLREHESELRHQLRDWHRESAELHDESNELQRELAVAEERIRLLKARREELLAELEPMREQTEAQAEQVAEMEARADTLTDELRRRQAALAEREEEWEGIQAKVEAPLQRRDRLEEELRDARAEQERLSQALADRRAEVSRLESDRAVAEERARQLKARHQELLAELEPLGEREEAQMMRLEQSREQVDRLEGRLAAKKQSLAETKEALRNAERPDPEPTPEQRETEQALQARRQRLADLDETLIALRAQEAHLAGELETLERLHATGAAYETGVQAVMQADLEGVLGPLVGLIQVPADWERAVEAALGVDLQMVLVERADVVRPVRRVIRSAGGRVTLLPLDRVRRGPSLPDGVRSARDVVTCDESVRGAVDALLGPIALCDDVETAWALLPQLAPGSCCVTRTGVVLRADGALSIGEIAVDGVLADTRARQEELPATLNDVRRKIARNEAEQATEQEAIAGLEKRMAVLDRQAAEGRERTVREAQERLGQARTELAVTEETLRNQQETLQRERSALEDVRDQATALRRQAAGLEAEYVEIVGQPEGMAAERRALSTAAADVGVRIEIDQVRQALVARVERAERDCERIEARQQEQTERIEALERALEAASREVAEAAEEGTRFEREVLGEARTRVAVAEETLRRHQEALARERALLDRLETQIEARRERAADLQSEHDGVVARAGRLRQESARLQERLRATGQRIQPAEETLAGLTEEQSEVEKAIRRARDRVRDVEARHGRAQLVVDRRKDELTLLAERIEEDLGMVELELADDITAQSPLPLHPMVSALPVVETLPEGLEDEIKRLKARLRRLGGVNPGAPEDYEEVKERYEFLTEQSADLESASEQLREVVAELDELMEAAFKETFDAVAEEFSETFTLLFNGGSARLQLTEPDDLMETGVEIVAHPPGKRAQRLALLSGGERSLTAVALLFSLLRISPAPFCVLDEVDAMLDEANVGRFRTLLEELSQQTQFIIITHNRGTVESADTVYGVSMGADGVSQVVSLKFDEEEAELV